MVVQQVYILHSHLKSTMRCSVCPIPRNAAFINAQQLSSGILHVCLPRVLSVRTHWVTTTNFIGLLLIPRFRVYLGTSSAVLGMVCVSPDLLSWLTACDDAPVATGRFYLDIGEPRGGEHRG